MFSPLSSIFIDTSDIQISNQFFWIFCSDVLTLESPFGFQIVISQFYWNISVHTLESNLYLLCAFFYSVFYQNCGMHLICYCIDSSKRKNKKHLFHTNSLNSLSIDIALIKLIESMTHTHGYLTKKISFSCKDKFCYISMKPFKYLAFILYQRFYIRNSLFFKSLFVLF